MTRILETGKLILFSFRARRKSHSGALSSSSSGEMLTITPSSSIKNTKYDSANVEMEIKMMEERRRKGKKKDNKDKKKRDKDIIDRERTKEGRESENESLEFSKTPTKKTGKRKLPSRDSEDLSSSDSEWKKCGLKGNI